MTHRFATPADGYSVASARLNTLPAVEIGNLKWFKVACPEEITDFQFQKIQSAQTVTVCASMSEGSSTNYDEFNVARQERRNRQGFISYLSEKMAKAGYTRLTAIRLDR